MIDTRLVERMTKFELRLRHLCLSGGSYARRILPLNTKYKKCQSLYMSDFFYYIHAINIALLFVVVV